MENKDKKNIDIIKIISIIIFITILSSILIISTFAYDVSGDYILNYINLSTNALDSSQSILAINLGSVPQKIIINGNEYNYKIINIYGNNEIIDHIRINTDLYGNYQYVTFSNYESTNNRPLSEITNIQINTVIADDKIQIFNTVFQKNIYEETPNLLSYALNSVKTLIDYMIANNVILIVIAIVIVSFGIGMLIRINRKKF